MEVKKVHRAACHCGAVRLELQLPDGLVDPRHCNCSMCKRRGAIVATVPLAALTVLQGEEDLKVYQFNTNTAKHYFCGRCGIYTHHRRRSNPEQFTFNVGCLEGVNPFEVQAVTVYNGAVHPRDDPAGGRPLFLRIRTPLPKA